MKCRISGAGRGEGGGAIGVGRTGSAGGRHGPYRVSNSMARRKTQWPPQYFHLEETQDFQTEKTRHLLRMPIHDNAANEGKCIASRSAQKPPLFALSAVGKDSCFRAVGKRQLASAPPPLPRSIIVQAAIIVIITLARSLAAGPTNGRRTPRSVLVRPSRILMTRP